MEANRSPVPPSTNDAQAPRTAAPPSSHRYKLIICRFVLFAAPTILALLVIFHAMPAVMLREHGRDSGSSLSSSNISISISISHSKQISMEFTHMKLLLSSDSQFTLSLSSPSLGSNSTQAPSCGTSLRAKVQTTLSIVTDLGVNGLEMNIEAAAKANRKVRLGPWLVPKLNVDVSCTYMAFAAQSDSGDGRHQMILQGTLSCSLDIVPEFW